MRKDGHQTGVVAEYYVLSQLLRYGHDAYITIGKKKAIDIHVFHESGLAMSIDVKAVRDYSSWPVSNIKKSTNHFIAFVAYKKKFEDLSSSPDVYIVPSTEVAVLQTKAGGRSFKKGTDPYKNNWGLYPSVKC